MKFLDVDVKRSLASANAIVGEGNIVVFRPQDSFVENSSICQRIPICRRKGVFVVQSDAQAGKRTEKTVRCEEPNTNERTPVSRQAASVNPNVEEIRERCKAK